MGTSLTGLTPATTYDALIKVGDNGPIDGTLKTLSDGLGNDLPMQASTAAVNFTGTLTQSGVALQPVLVSGTNIKTINGATVLGSGNIVTPSTPPSGVSGAIQFSNGSAFASDAANFFWDDTNKRLGIGTNTPSTRLHILSANDPINGNFTTRGNLFIATSESATINVGGTLALGGYFAGTTNIATFGKVNGKKESSSSGATDGYLSFETLQNAGNALIERMRITSVGNIGIGETAPTSKFQVRGSGSTSATTSLLVQNSGGTASLQVTDDGSVFNYGKGALTTNTAFGVSAIGGNNTAGNLSAFGRGALQTNTSGSSNSAFGRNALSANSSGSSNSAFGVGCLTANTSGSNNSSLGVDTSSGNFSGSVILGNEATATANNQFVVGSSTTNAGAVNSTTDVPATFLWSVRINGTNYKILMTT